MRKSAIARSIILGLAAMLVVSSATAGPARLTTKITFSQPVRVPGVTLNAGTYYFSAPNANNRTLVSIENEQREFVTQFMGIADYSVKLDHNIILFGDHECGPKAIKSWFYPGSGSGIRFVYPEDEAALIAASCNEPVPETHDRKLDASNIQTSNVYMITPQKQETAYKAEALSTSDQRDRSGMDADPR